VSRVGPRAGPAENCGPWDESCGRKRGSSIQTPLRSTCTRWRHERRAARQDEIHLAALPNKCKEWFWAKGQVDLSLWCYAARASCFSRQRLREGILLLPLGARRQQRIRRSSFLRADSDASFKLDITDAVFTLGYLFLGSGTPRCLKARRLERLGADRNHGCDLHPGLPLPRRAGAAGATGSVRHGSKLGRAFLRRLSLRLRC